MINDWIEECFIKVLSRLASEGMSYNRLVVFGSSLQ